MQKAIDILSTGMAITSAINDFFLSIKNPRKGHPIFGKHTNVYTKTS